jgi:hypothetical protein
MWEEKLFSKQQGADKMKLMIKASGLFLGLLLLTEFCVAAPFVHEASFYQVFSGKDYFTANSGSKVDFTLSLSTMSSDGKIVAFYGSTYFDSISHRKLFIHNFEATTDPVEVTLPVSIGSFNTNAGMISNADGSRIFFLASSTVTYSNLFCMLNGLTGEVTILLDATYSIAEKPQDIATDANGDYLYFNENDNGYGTGDLWRIQAIDGAVPELIIDADTIGHPSGGVGKFIDQFDVSDDGSTIAFFINGRHLSDGTSIRFDKELFVKTGSGIRFLTNNEQNGKNDLVISGDGSTIVYSGSPTGSWDWMVTAPDAAVEGQGHIESGYHNCGDRPGITTDGSIIFGRSTLNGTSACYGYLIKTDGSGRQMVEPNQISFLGTQEGLHLSGDGKRVFFKNRSYVYPDAWYNMTAGVFDKSLWTTEVPRITNVTYPADLFSKLENNERFDVNIGAGDPQEDVTIDNVESVVLFPNGYEDRGGAGPINIYYKTYAVPGRDDLYTTEGYRGSSWPDSDPVTVRFSVEDQDGNISYADTEIKISDFTVDKITHTSPSGTTQDSTPTFTWVADSASTWYKLWVGYPNDELISALWYDAADICFDGNCSVPLETELLDGNYEWYVKSWNDDGSVWSDGMTFTVQGDDTPPSKVTHTSPSGLLAASMSTFTWVEDPASTWYKVWVGYSNGNRIFAQWYDAANICFNGTCSVTTGTEFDVGNYEWYIKSWNDYGRVWSDGMSFEVE